MKPDGYRSHRAFSVSWSYAMDYQTVLEAVRALPNEDRVRLLNEIHDEMDAEDRDFFLTDEQSAEIQRRIAAYDADPSIGIPWEEVEARLDKQLEELGE